MAEPRKSKGATYKALNSWKEGDEVLDPNTDSYLDAVEKSTSMNKGTGKKGKTAKRLTSKRRTVFICCTSSDHSRAAEVVGSNEDLLTEILFLVPMKSLLKFKSVSKHWNSLLSDSKFVSNYTCRNPSSSLISGLYFNHLSWKKTEIRSVSLHGHSLPTLAFLDPLREGLESRVVDSCNGLLLFSNGGKMDYIVCNPITKKYIALPELGGSTSSTYWTHFGAYLAFDPSKSPYYKVVLVSYHFDDRRQGSYRIYIYSSKSASWRKMLVKAPEGGSYGCRVFWNGAIHWMSYADVHIQFDIDTENLIGIPMPELPNILSEDMILYFGECGGSLLLIQSRNKFAMGFNMLEMKKDHCRSIVKCRVNLRHIRSIFPEEFRSSYKVLCCVNGATEKDFSIVLAIPGKVIVYNLNRKTAKVLLELQGASYEYDGFSYHDTYPFIGSLSPL